MSLGQPVVLQGKKIDDHHRTIFGNERIQRAEPFITF